MNFRERRESDKYSLRDSAEASAFTKIPSKAKRGDIYDMNIPMLLLLLYGLQSSRATVLPLPGQVGGPCLPGRNPCILSNSECIDGICLCTNFYRFINGSCATEESTTLGRSCRGGSECRGQGEFCSSFAICMCLSTHVEIGNQCKPAVYPGQFGCEDSRQCSKGFPGAECDISRTCVCPMGMIAHQTTCVMPSALSNLILSDEHLLPLRNRYSLTNFYRRRAPVQHNAASNGLPPDSLCSTDSDCAGYPLSFCDGTCRCVSGAINAGTTCLGRNQALQPAAACPPGQTYITEAGACMTVQNPGHPCQYTQQCAASEPGAFCLRLRCECVYGMKQSGTGCTFVNNECTQRGHIWISELGECKEVIPPGGYGCSHSLQCTAAYPEATCFMQTCTCPPTFPIAIDGTCGRNCSNGETYSGVTGQCLPTVQPGGQCVYSSQCQAFFGGMQCDRNVCRCSGGQVFTGMKCEKRCPQGYMPNSRGICVHACRSNQVEYDGECLEEALPGQNCVVNVQCKGGSICEREVCRCPKGTVSHNGECLGAESHRVTQSTLITVDIGDQCVRVGVKCTGSSVCIAGVCVCPLGTTINHKECVPYTTATPGASCAKGEECLDNSYCNKETKRCECKSDTQMVIGSNCVERLRSHVGYPCNNKELCVGGSVCDSISNKCVCPKNKKEVDKQCVDLTIALPGDKCGTQTLCSGGSKCDYLTKICACSRGEETISGECVSVSIIPPGERCNRALNNRCGGGSYCLRGRCECPQNMRPLDKKCVQQRQVLPGQKCGSSDSCMGKSICTDGTCTCPEGTYLRGTICSFRRKVEAGGECQENDLCLGGSECSEGFCHCTREGDVVRNGVCGPRKTARPGFICEPDDICTGQSICIESRCQCQIGFKISNGKCAAEVKVAIGESCSETIDCMDGICLDGRCLCAKGTVPKGNACVQAESSIGMSCNNGEECVGNSFCDGRICTCRENQRPEAGFCVDIPRPSSERQVLTLRPPTPGPGPAEIKSLPEVRPTSARPQPQSSVSRCRNNSECPRSSVCNRGFCSCPPGSQMRNGVCSSIAGPRKPGLLGHPCLSSDDCKVPNSICSNSTCECRVGYRIFGSTQCIIRSDFASPAPTLVTTHPPNALVTLPTIFLVLPGEMCDRMRICQRGSTCIEGKCSCGADSIFVHGSCVRRRPIQVRPLSSCLAGEICPENAECVYGVCLCSADFTLFRGECKDTEEIRDILQKEAETMMTSRRPRPRLPYTLPYALTSSTSTPTTSPTPFLPPTILPIMPTTEESQTLFKLAKPGFPCDSTIQCVNCSACINSFCQCPEGLALVGDACVSPADARNCVSSLQCPSGAHCVKGQCKCLAGLAPSRFGFCIPINYADPGTSCAFGEECRGNSHCAEGLCVCNDGLYLIDNRCEPSPETISENSISSGSRKRRQISSNDRSFLDRILRAVENSVEWSGVGAGERCSGNVKCVDGASCVNNYCRCISRVYVQTGQACILRNRIAGPIASVGAYCSPGTFCDGGASCIRTICTCQSTHRNENGICVRILANPSESCANGERCTGGSVCLSSICTCPSHTTLVNNTECVPSFPNAIQRSPGLNCMNNPNVCTGGSYCFNGVCACPIGQVPVNGVCSASGINPTVSPTGTTAYAKPGEPCIQGTTTCTGNSICANNFCVCPGGEQIRDGVCISVDSQADPGEMCQVGITTCTGNSICTQGVCRCPSGQIALNGQCAKIIGQGNLAYPLVRDTGCSPVCGQYSQCVEGQCMCNQGYGYSNGLCQPNSCNPPCPQFSSCNPGGYCSCNTGYSYSNGLCMPSNTYQNTGCNNNCGQYSYCQNNQCNCVPGYSMNAGQCSPAINSNSINSCNPPCGNNAHCQQNECYCNQGYSMQSGACLPSCNPPCPQNSYCMKSYCYCNPGYQDSGGSCIPQNSAYSSSSCNPPCGQNSYCYQDSCNCNSGYQNSGGSCIPQNSAYSSSSCNPPCGQNSYCYQGSCNCNSGYQLNSGVCQSQQNQCDPPCGSYASCQQGSCYCNQGYSLSNGQCQPSCSSSCQPNCNQNCQPSLLQNDAVVSPFFGMPGQQCDMRPGAMMCRSQSLCVNNRCICPNNLVLSNNQCVQFAGNAYPGQSCQTPGTICKGGSSCAPNSLCVCEPNYSIFNGECVPSSLPTPPPYAFELRPGQSCDPRCEFEPCLQKCGGSSLCVNGVCTCPLGSVEVSGSCIIVSAYQTDTGNCLNNSCLQPVTQRLSMDGGSGSARPGDPCDVNSKCIGGSTCLIGTCTCEQGYVPSFDRSSCVLSSSLPRIAFRSYSEDGCTMDSECSGGALCVNRRCACRRGLHYIEGKCVPFKWAYPGSVCNTTCTLGSVCRKNFCVCHAGHTTNSTGHCVPYAKTDTSAALPGAECTSTNTICEGGSVCSDKYCLCLPPTFNTGNGSCNSQKLTLNLEFRSYPKLGDSCSLQSDCKMPNSTCIDYKCDCIENFEKINDRCQEKVQKPKLCRSFRDCDSPRICDSDGHCKCPFTMDDINGVCLYRNNTVPPGSFCDENVKCGENSECINHVCAIPSNQLIPVGKPCTNHDACAHGAICRNNLCVCERGVSADGVNCKGMTRRRDNNRRMPPPKNENLTACPSDGSCALPHCYCSRSGMEIPGGLERKEIPQMIVLTFSGPITDRVINIYKSLFDGKLRNPNGCPIRGTFFISHQFNNYDQTQWVHSRGGEIAVHSITSEVLRDKSSERWRHEMAGMRDSLRAFSYADKESVKGIRAPHLILGGDDQFEMMERNEFEYDSSMPVSNGPYWPQTLDHSIAWDCGEQRCPKKPHKGIWEIPIQMLQGNDGMWKESAIKTIKPYDTKITIKQFLQRNFYRNYKSNRAPFVLNADAEWLNYAPDNQVAEALEEWLQDVLNKTDVYVVTNSQLISWMKNPKKVDDVRQFRAWQCNFLLNDHVHPCENPSVCSYAPSSGLRYAHSFRVCGSCPKSYPWIEDPLGTRQLS